MRTPRDEVAEATPLGELYLRRLRRRQLRLSLLALTAFGALVGVLPLVLYALELRVGVLGVPLAILLVVVPPYPLFLAIGWLHQHRADALDEDFRRIVGGG